jgi:hypothetical protein
MDLSQDSHKVGPRLDLRCCQSSKQLGIGHGYYDPYGHRAWLPRTDFYEESCEE